jgi:hypothetical protein
MFSAKEGFELTNEKEELKGENLAQGKCENKFHFF